MYLICYGTRPELIKLIPLINKFKEININFLTLFSGQHPDLIEQFYNLVPPPDILVENIMEKGQCLDNLIAKILIKMSDVFQKYRDIKNVIIQGDTSTAYSIALSSFHNNKKIIHVEAGLRTFDKYSPFPEEMNRIMISRLADIHLCPTIKSVENLKNEGVKHNIYLVGNTIVDTFDYVSKNTDIPNNIKHIVDKGKYIVVTLHRRENRGERMKTMWKQLNELSDNYKIIYITHPSLPESKEILNNKITKLEPLGYIEMVHLIKKCHGIITDSGGLQEEAVCAKKKVLVCRKTTEREETIECGYGYLVDTDIINNVSFFDEQNKIIVNPYGKNVCDKILNLL